MGGISDRKQEIKRRRHRKKTLVIFKREPETLTRDAFRALAG